MVCLETHVCGEKPTILAIACGDLDDPERHGLNSVPHWQRYWAIDR